MKQPFYTPTKKEYLNSYELSLNLDIPESAVYQLVELGLIPSQRFDEELRFYDEDLQRWSLEVEILYERIMDAKFRLGIGINKRQLWKYL